jgi:integrase
MPRTPKYSLHKATGQARVTLDGKDHYLGQYGSTESRRRYNQLVEQYLQRWAVRASSISSDRTIGSLVLLYDDEHVQTHYRKHGRPTSEVACIKIALGYLCDLFGDTFIADFGPVRLKQVRSAMVDDGHARKSINKHIGRIRRFVSWCVENEHCPPSVLSALKAVQGLQKGRTQARETAPVKPVPEDRIEAIQPYVPAPIWAMIQAQRLTGMRSGEVTAMCGNEIDMIEEVWVYVPDEHKTEHYEKDRVVFIGPRCQAVLRPFLKADPHAFIFCPRDVRDTAPGSNRRPGERYRVDSYYNSIVRACEKAFAMPKELRLISKKLPLVERERLKGLAREWRQQNCWHPHQLRHNAGTTVRAAAASLDTARCVLV